MRGWVVEEADPREKQQSFLARLKVLVAVVKASSEPHPNEKFSVEPVVHPIEGRIMSVKAEVPDVPVANKRIAFGVKPKLVMCVDSVKGNPVVFPDLANEPTLKLIAKLDRYFSVQGLILI